MRETPGPFQASPPPSFYRSSSGIARISAAAAVPHRRSLERSRQVVVPVHCDKSQRSLQSYIKGALFVRGSILRLRTLARNNQRPTPRPRVDEKRQMSNGANFDN